MHATDYSASSASDLISNRDRRVDHAHGASHLQRGAEQPVSAVGLADRSTPDNASMVQSASAMADWVSHQAAELAESLQSQQAELDRRESDLNARMAAVENELRTARLWLDEREQDVQSRQEQLDKLCAEQSARRQDLDRHATQLASQASRLETIGAELAEEKEDCRARWCELEEREGRLAERQREIEKAIERFERLGIVEEKMGQLETQTAQIEQQRKTLSDALATINTHQADLASQQQQLKIERQDFQRQLDHDRQQFEAERRSEEAQLARNQQVLSHRSEELDRREASLDELKTELLETQREVLEMRLASEELWSQLSGALAPASLGRSISEIRAKLADHFRLATSDLAERKEELEKVGEWVSGQHEQLVKRKSELESWVRRREEDIDEQAARVLARERALDQQEVHHRELEMKWSDERLAYQQEIRQLLGKTCEAQPAT